MRATVRGYLRAVLLGALVGGGVGLGGEWQAVLRNRSTVGYGSAALFGVLIGSSAGAFLYALRDVRKRGRRGHYLSWAGAVGLGSAVVAAPGLLVEGDWLVYLGIVAAGIGVGLALALIHRRWLGHGTSR